MIDKYSIQYTGDAPGKSLLVFGAIHGNEVCGPIAIQNVINAISGDTLIIKSGAVTFVPICNPMAYEKQQRQIDKNLNRIFDFSGKASYYEETLVKPLQKLIEAHDYILDIHSISGGDETFLFESNNDPETVALGQATGIYTVIEGRNDLYNESGRTTDQYAASLGKGGICIECGHHQNPNAPKIAYNAIIGCMQHLGIIEGGEIQPQNRKVYTMKTLFMKEYEGDFIKEYKHGDKIQQGEILCKYNNGDVLTSPITGYILLPKHRAKVGEEWFYLAILEK